MLVILDPNTYRALYPSIANDGHIVMNLNANIIDPNIPILNLIPHVNITLPEDLDSYYIDAILNEDDHFMALMTVMILLKHGHDVYLLSYSADGVLGPIIEIVLKLIQCRYGYNYQLLNNVEDFDPNQQVGFTAVGIMTLDKDTERYEQLMTMLYPDMFINEQINDEHL